VTSFVEIVFGVLFFLAFVVGTVRSLPTEKSLLEQDDYVVARDMPHASKD
jgi:uncharacterized iron-regulated protein